MRQVDAARVAVGWTEVQPERLARLEPHRTAREAPDAQLGPLQVGQDTDRAAEFAPNPARRLATLAVLVGRAVAEIEPEHIDAGLEQRADRLLGRGRWSERGDDLGIAISRHGILA